MLCRLKASLGNPSLRLMLEREVLSIETALLSRRGEPDFREPDFRQLAQWHRVAGEGFSFNRAARICLS